MNLLKAQVRNTPKWWEIELLDLNIVADGANEQEMLRNLEFTLTAEYHFAKKFGKTPFVDLIKGDPQKIQAWKDGDKKLRGLNLPTCVSEALSLVFREPNLQQYGVPA